MYPMTGAQFVLECPGRPPEYLVAMSGDERASWMRAIADVAAVLRECPRPAPAVTAPVYAAAPAASAAGPRGGGGGPAAYPPQAAPQQARAWRYALAYWVIFISEYIPQAAAQQQQQAYQPAAAASQQSYAARPAAAAAAPPAAPGAAPRAICIGVCGLCISECGRRRAAAASGLERGRGPGDRARVREAAWICIRVLWGVFEIAFANGRAHRYYWNTTTNATSWKRPGAPVPVPAPAPAPAPVYAPAPAPAPVYAPASAPAPVCRGCGTPHEVGDLFCDACGSKLR